MPTKRTHGFSYRAPAGARGPVMKKLKTLERKVAMNKPELKYHVVNIDSALQADDQSLMNIPTGTSQLGRIGDEVRVHNIEWFIRAQSYSTTSGNRSLETPRLVMYVCNNDPTYNLAGDGFTYFSPPARDIVWQLSDQRPTLREEGLYHLQGKKSFGPSGMICKWDGSGSYLIKNNIRLLWTHYDWPGQTSDKKLEGYVRITYTDP